MFTNPLAPDLPVVKQHIHYKNVQDYPEWENAVIFRIIPKISAEYRDKNNSLGFHVTVNEELPYRKNYMGSIL